MRKSSAAILMAAYNGEKFIGEQIMSIIAQTYKDWVLLIRDDGSTDRTVEIIRDFSRQDERIKLILDENGHLGNCQNFSVLMDHVATSQYIFFSDQDDYWFQDKIKKQVDIISRYGNNPAALYSNYYLADESLKKYRIAYAHKPNEYITILSMENHVMGCTLVINNPLLKIVKEIPCMIDNHDHWIATIAKALDCLQYDREPHICHRVHDNNVTTTRKNLCIANRVQEYFKSMDNTTAWIQKQYLFHKAVGKRIKDWGEENGKIAKCEQVFSGSVKHPVVFCAKNNIRTKNIRRKVYMYYALYQNKKLNKGGMS